MIVLFESLQNLSLKLIHIESAMLLKCHIYKYLRYMDLCNYILHM